MLWSSETPRGAIRLVTHPGQREDTPEQSVHVELEGADQTALNAPYHTQNLASQASHPVPAFRAPDISHLIWGRLTSPFLAFPMHTTLSSHI